MRIENLYANSWWMGGAIDVIKTESGFIYRPYMENQENLKFFDNLEKSWILKNNQKSWKNHGR